jgi:hypothetical protein
MVSIDRLERTVKAANLVLELAKTVVFFGLAMVVFGAVAAPDWIGGRIKALNMKIESIDLPFIKLVADETKASNANTIQVAEALTKAEIELSEDPSNANTTRALEAIRSAKLVLDEQSKSMAKVANKAGLSVGSTAEGWLYVGYFNESGTLVRQSDRIQPDSVSLKGGNPTQLTLRFDAPIISDGDNCNRLDISKFNPPDPKEKKTKYALVRANADPLQILSVVECDSVGGGKQKYARVAIPPDRIRFAELSSLDK